MLGCTAGHPQPPPPPQLISIIMSTTWHLQYINCSWITRLRRRSISFYWPWSWFACSSFVLFPAPSLPLRWMDGSEHKWRLASGWTLTVNLAVISIYGKEIADIHFYSAIQWWSREKIFKSFIFPTTTTTLSSSSFWAYFLSSHRPLVCCLTMMLVA